MAQQRILVVCQHFWPESFRLNDVCDYFVEQGFAVDVLCGIPNYPKGKFYENYTYVKNRKQQHNGVNIRRVFEIPRGQNSNFGIFLNNISFSIASLFHIPRLLMKKYDRIFIYQLSPVMMAAPGIIIGKLKKVPITMWVIDPWPESLFSFLPINNQFLRKVATVVSHWHYRHVDKLVLLSDRMRDKMIEITHFDKSRVIMLPQACEKLYEEQPKDPQLSKRFRGGFNITFAGVITPILSFQTVVAAATTLHERGYTDINWIIIGDGMAREWLETVVAKHKLSEHFFFEGFLPKEEIPRYTTNATDLLLSTLVKSDFLEATVPAKITSYFAAGKPIVLGMDGAAHDLINKVGCGFAGPAEDVSALADNIEKIYKMSKSERAILGKKAHDYYYENFERNIVMKKLLEFMYG